MRNYLRAVKGTKDLAVSADGEAFSCKDSDEYELVKTHMRGGGKTKGSPYKGISHLGKCYYLHRLIVETFIGSLDGKEVNHINGDKYDNRVDNLEIVTGSENMLHAYKIGIRKPAHKGIFGAAHPASKAVIHTETGKEYVNAREAAKALALNYKGISDVIHKRRASHKGTTWRLAQ